ncbi:hypothetical protein ABZ851_35525 [Streptomyces sp. NPDC047049]|uniref:hypothetical protein n=1 Tax=Streptomyces sp. NPDC047049 TaxID=3156688 RepID=UPI0033C2A6E3
MSVSGVWCKVTQADACAGEQGQRPTTLRVTGKLENPEHYDPSVPRTIHSDALKPAATSVIPKGPAMTSVHRLDADTVRVTWKPVADHRDQALLMKRKPFYSSEIGLWHPYTFQRDVLVRATSIDRKLERDSDIPLRPDTRLLARFAGRQRSASDESCKDRISAVLADPGRARSTAGR